MLLLTVSVIQSQSVTFGKNCWTALGSCLEEAECKHRQTEQKFACFDAIGRPSSYKCSNDCQEKLLLLSQNRLGKEYMVCDCSDARDMLCMSKKVRINIC